MWETRRMNGLRYEIWSARGLVETSRIPINEILNIQNVPIVRKGSLPLACREI